MRNLILGLLLSAFLILPAQAQVNLFTDHQVVYMLQHGVNAEADVKFPSGSLPYIGRIGVEYVRSPFSYQLAYIHRSNVDIISGDEYYYDGVSLAIKYTHCVAFCP